MVLGSFEAGPSVTRMRVRRTRAGYRRHVKRAKGRRQTEKAKGRRQRAKAASNRLPRIEETATGNDTELEESCEALGASLALAKDMAGRYKQDPKARTLEFSAGLLKLYPRLAS